jgi:protein-S-isoprenylcysteine O-methyltransferase Ste14
VNDEGLFRIAAVALLLAGSAVGLRFRRRAARSGENLWSQRRQEGPVLLALRALAGLMLLGGVVIYLINPSWMAWAQLPVPIWLRWTAAAVGAAMLPPLWWVLATLGTNLADTVAIRRAHTLVTTGPYR